MNLNIRTQYTDRAKPNLDFSWVAGMKEQLHEASLPKPTVEDV